VPVKANWHEIENPETHPLPRGGTDLIPTLQLRHHFGGIPISAQGLYLSGIINFNDVDAFKVYLSALLTDATSRPFYGGAIAGYENLILGKANFLKGGGNRLEKFGEFLMTNKCWRVDGVVRNRIFRERVDPGLLIHRAQRCKVSLHCLSNNFWRHLSLLPFAFLLYQTPPQYFPGR